MYNRRRTAHVRTITEALAALIPGAKPAHLTVTVTETSPLDGACNTWTGDAYGLAERIATSLFGRPTGDHPTVPGQAPARYPQLNRQPWYPALAGDVVHVHYEGTPQAAVGGETYIVDRAAPGPHPDELLTLRLLCHTVPTEMAGWFAVGDSLYPLDPMWFEAGPARLTIVRNGRVVHAGGGAR